MKPLKRYKIVIVFLLCLFAANYIHAQDMQQLTQARVYVDKKQYKEAIELYEKLYEQSAGKNEIYDEYMYTLLLAKEYKDAEKLAEKQLKLKQNSPLVIIDLGRVYEASGKEKKAEQQYSDALQYINGDDMLTQQIANAFTAIGRDDYALKAYEKAREILHNPFMYSGPMITLYAKAGDMESAISTLLDAGPAQFGGMEEAKSTLLEIVGDDAEKLRNAQKAIIKRINEQPDNHYYPELLTWLYTQKDDWEGALIQVRALDARSSSPGQRLLIFAREALKEKEYDIAVQALQAVVDKGNETPFYAMSKGEVLKVQMKKLEDNPRFAKEELDALAKQYEAFLQEFPQYYSSEVTLDYATLLAQYSDNPKKAIEVLQKAIDAPNASKDFTGKAKLQMGDYQVLTGDIWEAALTYGQVDKANREDVLGEEARFRNAKLAYYRGDFEWAEGQLSVLKASTTELIANDALYLSVLITENITPDSNYVPLERFAAADLLLFQNKDKEAEKLLDSISTNYPKHPLVDDILMLKAQLAVKHGEYKKALDLYNEVYVKHGDDVLGDDALYKSAELHADRLNDKATSDKKYEELILKYPGSTYVQSARKKLREDKEEEKPLIP